jgi:hypothetical protein
VDARVRERARGEGAARAVAVAAQRYALSDLNPAMWTVKSLAEGVRRARKPVDERNAYRALEQQASDRLEQGLRSLPRPARQRAGDRCSGRCTAHRGCAPRWACRARRRRRARATRGRGAPRAQDARGRGHMEQGGFLEGWARIAAYVGKGNAVDERPLPALRK